MGETAAFCHKCGTALPAGAAFCPRCGFAISGSPATPSEYQPSAGRTMREKEEKREKQEKGEKGEKAQGSGMLGALVGGLLLIWLGITFFLEQNGYLASDVWWAYFLAGVGVILIVQAAVLYSTGRRGYGSLIGGFILLFIGFGSIAAVSLSLTARLWPLILVALGILVLATGLASRRRVPRP